MSARHLTEPAGLDALKLPFKSPRATAAPRSAAANSVALRNACVFLAVVAGGAALKYFQGIVTPW